MQVLTLRNDSCFLGATSKCHSSWGLFLLNGRYTLLLHCVLWGGLWRRLAWGEVHPALEFPQDGVHINISPHCLSFCGVNSIEPHPIRCCMTRITCVIACDCQQNYLASLANCSSFSLSSDRVWSSSASICPPLGVLWSLSTVLAVPSSEAWWIDNDNHPTVVKWRIATQVEGKNRGNNAKSQGWPHSCHQKPTRWQGAVAGLRPWSCRKLRRRLLKAETSGSWTSPMKMSLKLPDLPECHKVNRHRWFLRQNLQRFPVLLIDSFGWLRSTRLKL